jgi:hypothetical protein
VPQPGSFEEKRAHAALLRDFHDFRFEIAIDDIDGSLHRAMSPKPNSAYLLGADGSIAFRAHWANATRALAAALEDTTAARPPRNVQSHGLTRPIWPTVRYIAPILTRAGAGAWRDMWRAVPPMAALAWLFRVLRLQARVDDPAAYETRKVLEMSEDRYYAVRLLWVHDAFRVLVPSARVKGGRR